MKINVIFDGVKIPSHDNLPEVSIQRINVITELSIEEMRLLPQLIVDTIYSCSKLDTLEHYSGVLGDITKGIKSRSEEIANGEFKEKDKSCTNEIVTLSQLIPKKVDCNICKGQLPYRCMCEYVNECEILQEFKPMAPILDCYMCSHHSTKIRSIKTGFYVNTCAKLGTKRCFHCAHKCNEKKAQLCIAHFDGKCEVYPKDVKPIIPMPV